MKTQPWQRVFAIFEQAIELPPGEWPAFLDRACGDDDTLRGGIEMLLAAHQEDGTDPLDRPMIELPPGLEMEDAAVAADPAAEGRTDIRGGEAPLSSAEGTMGPYRILRRIGQGGMSTVYLAVREDDVYRRRVVIKVVRSDRETEPMLQRLRVERRILANLEHPNIARLYDGGNTAEGLPYFVMEYVEGVPIDAFCAQHQLSVDDRLTLFRKVCGAVHYAHQNLVVHRDIKPSNILVTADGEPRLLDFGIAKLLDPESIPGIEPTATWQRLLTPSYASPEQIRGQPVNTVSDVYSLGVLLYELLTGRLPYEFKGRSAHEIELLLGESEPEKPSTVVSRSATTQDMSDASSRHSAETEAYPAAGTGRSAASRARTRALKQALEGDVDAIVMKALRVKPSQRYDSVERLAADIESYQRGLPVAARAGSWRYRTEKWARRNRRALAGAVALLALVISFVAALALQAERVRRERDQARLESDKKSRVVALILDIFELSNPYVMPDADMTVRDALEHSVPLLAGGLKEQPDVRAQLLHTAGSIFSVLGSFNQAEELLTDAFEIRRGLYSEEDPRIAESMTALASVRKELDDDLDEAERLARDAVEVLRANLGSDHPDLTDPLIELVTVLCYRGKYQSAEPLAAEALALARQLPTEDDRKITALEFLAHIHSNRGEYAQAVALNRQALAFYRQLYGEKYPGQIATLSNLGVQLRRMGELEAAQRTYEEALQLHRETYGHDYADLILLNNFAGVRYAMGDFAGAESLYREALDVVLKRYGSEHWRVLKLGLRIARTRIHQGDAVAAEGEIRRLQQRRLVDADHLLNDEARSVLGESLSVQGRCDEARPVLVESFEIILAKAGSARQRRDAFDRLRNHLDRCGQPQDIARYEAMLASDRSAARTSS